MTDTYTFLARTAGFLTSQAPKTRAESTVAPFALSSFEIQARAFYSATQPNTASANNDALPPSIFDASKAPEKVA